VFYSSIFFSSLPLGTIGGDVTRVWLARKFALSLRQLVLSVLIDRMLVVGTFIVLALIGLPSIAQPLATTIWLVCAAARWPCGHLSPAAADRPCGGALA
jgi:hypothetical protein